MQSQRDFDCIGETDERALSTELVPDRKLLPYFVSSSCADVLEGIIALLVDRSIGLAVLSGPQGVGKTRLLCHLCEYLRWAFLLESGDLSTRPECHSNGYFICLQPVILRESDLIDATRVADIAGVVDRVLQSGREAQAALSSEAVAKIPAESVRFWVVLLVDDVDQLSQATRDALIDHALMARPQACLTVLCGGPALPEEVSRAHGSSKLPRRRDMRFFTLPTLDSSESILFLRHAITHWALASHERDFSYESLMNLQNGKGTPYLLQDALWRYMDAPDEQPIRSDTDESRWRWLIMVLMTLSGLFVLLSYLGNGNFSRNLSTRMSQYPQLVNVTPPNTTIPTELAQQTGNVNEEQVRVVDHQEGDLLSHQADAQLYDYPQAVKTVFDWPESGYLIQLGSGRYVGQMLAYARAVDAFLEQQSSNAVDVVILPTQHLGESWWIVVAGPYGVISKAEATVAALAQEPGLPKNESVSWWIRSVRDLQQAVLRMQEKPMPAKSMRDHERNVNR